MPADLDSQSAREALASVSQMTRAGARRAVWPRWAHALESIITATGITAFGLIWPSISIMMPVLAVFVCVVLGFRLFLVSRFGVAPRLNWLDGLIVLAVIAAFLGAIFLPPMTGIAWLVWAPGPLYGLLNFGREELRRRASLETRP